MTTVSGTSAATYVAPTTTPTTSTTATTTATPYDGTAAVAQAETLATQELNSGASGTSGNLLGLSPDILTLLQGSDNGGLNSLLGGGAGNAFYAQQATVALYGAAQKQAATTTDPISALIDSNNAIANAASAAAVAAVTAGNTDTSTGTDTTGTDTTA